MGRYTLEVVEPYFRESPVDDDQLSSALDAIATVHGGMVVESTKASARHYQRQFVNILDCEDLLEHDVEWLRHMFPYVRFALKEFTSS
jgi:hypothetical protein